MKCLKHYLYNNKLEIRNIIWERPEHEITNPSGYVVYLINQGIGKDWIINKKCKNLFLLASLANIQRYLCWLIYK